MVRIIDIDSVKLFLSVNEKHLSATLSKNILEEAEKLIFDTNKIYFVNSRLTTFANTKEKLSLEKLQTAKRWIEHFLNPAKGMDFLPLVFSDIFRIILPYEKREKHSASQLYKSLDEDGVLISPLKEQIGESYKKYHDLVSVCNILSGVPGKWEKLTHEPEVLGSKWDV
ncbi:MAG: hypothetical protein KIT56_11550, partial [Gammaproteobacteria bacterium]|nr:hypothetical protein [Gammaproteobacteria bacterium]